MHILLTGGTGFIGSHAAVEFLNDGYNVVIADNLYNSERSVIDRIQEITGKRPEFAEIDLTDSKAVSDLFDGYDFEGVVHFAGYKAVGESVEKPLMYYRNNLDLTFTLFEAMKNHGVNNFIFSSSATVYGAFAPVPYNEKTETGNCTNPYGWTKYMNEQIMKDLAAADPDLSIVLLRYFNPIGAHPSGLIGEKPGGIPNNLMPYITQVAAGIRKELSVFGNDYPTRDGTGVRDYIHVVDLAKGHLSAYRYSKEHRGCEFFNLGTGRGSSVLEVINAFEKANGVKIPYVIAERRSGDLPEYYADTEKAGRVLGWKAELTLEDMCRDSWRWQKNIGNRE